MQVIPENILKVSDHFNKMEVIWSGFKKAFGINGVKAFWTSEFRTNFLARTRSNSRSGTIISAESLFRIFPSVGPKHTKTSRCFFRGFDPSIPKSEWPRGL